MFYTALQQLNSLMYRILLTRCACRANGKLCTSKCHSSLSCSNKHEKLITLDFPHPDVRQIILNCYYGVRYE